jgi:hypothetical protein
MPRPRMHLWPVAWALVLSAFLWLFMFAVIWDELSRG